MKPWRRGLLVTKSLNDIFHQIRVLPVCSSFQEAYLETVLLAFQMHYAVRALCECTSRGGDKEKTVFFKTNTVSPSLIMFFFIFRLVS